MKGTGVKNNYIQLRKDFQEGIIKGTYLNLADYCRKHKLDYQTVYKACGNNMIKATQKQLEKAQLKTDEKISEELAKMNVKHLKRLEYAQKKSYQALKDYEPETYSAAIYGLTKTIELERDIIAPKGLDRNIVINLNIPRPPEQSAIDITPQQDKEHFTKGSKINEIESAGEKERIIESSEMPENTGKTLSDRGTPEADYKHAENIAANTPEKTAAAYNSMSDKRMLPNVLKDLKALEEIKALRHEEVEGL